MFRVSTLQVLIFLPVYLSCFTRFLLKFYSNQSFLLYYRLSVLTTNLFYYEYFTNRVMKRTMDRGLFTSDTMNTYTTLIHKIVETLDRKGPYVFETPYFLTLITQGKIFLWQFRLYIECYEIVTRVVWISNSLTRFYITIRNRFSFIFTKLGIYIFKQFGFHVESPIPLQILGFYDLWSSVVFYST